MSKVILAIADISCLSQDICYNDAYEAVSDYRKDKADRLKGGTDKQRCVASGLLLNAALQQWNKSDVCSDDSEIHGDDICHTKPKLQEVDICGAIMGYDKQYDYDITTYANGKPVFVEHKDIHFNISHAGKYVVCVLADCAVGVDIEGDREVRDNVAKRFFSKEECQWIEEKCEEKKRRFFELWTLKEAYGKLTGEGIALTIGRVSFSMGKTPKLIVSEGSKTENVEFYQYITEDNYYIALAKCKIVG